MLSDRQRLHDRQAEAGTHCGHALRRLAAVQLQQVGRERVDARCQLIVTGVDGKSHLLRPSPHTLAQRARGVGADVTGRRRKEDKADEIGPGLERHIERLEALKPADLDQNGHRRTFRYRAVLPRQ